MKRAGKSESHRPDSASSSKENKKVDKGMKVIGIPVQANLESVVIE